MPKQPAQTERVAIEARNRTGVSMVKMAQIEREITGYPENSWKRDAAKDWFRDNSLDVPAALVQKIEWAQNVLASAEGALMIWMMNNCPENVKKIQEIAGQLETSREESARESVRG